MVILAKTKLKDALKEYPQLKDFLISLSPKFKKLNNKFVYNLIGKFATFADIAKIGGFSLCELLHIVNDFVGTEEELKNHAPDCIKDAYINFRFDRPQWLEKGFKEKFFDATSRTDFFLNELLKTVKDLKKDEILKIKNSFFPAPLINLLKEEGFEFFVEEISDDEYFVYVKGVEKGKEPRRKVVPEVKTGIKVPVVIQSATPIVYPVIEELLKSERLKKLISIEELKIWDKTEKHLAWIVNKKADISFSAVAAVTKIFQRNINVKMKAVVVWDNFFILTRSFKANSFDELKNRKIYMPLIKGAPPYTITAYLMKKLGYDPKEFNFVFGKPFGRPEEIKNKLVKGEIEAALLREPEASFAIYEGNGEIVESIAFKDLWKKIFSGEGNLPNAGILFKGEFYEKFPEIANVFLEETKKAVLWVKNNKKDSAKNFHEQMKIPYEEALLFLNRAHFDFFTTEEVKKNLEIFSTVLQESGYSNNSFADLKDLFF